MQNFHFNPVNNRSVHLIKQLQLINKELDVKRKQLQKKKLEEEFYEDPNYVKQKKLTQNIYNPQRDNQAINYALNKNLPNQTNNTGNKNQNLSLADQIMNQLLSGNKDKKPNYGPGNQINQNKNQSNIMYQNMKNFNSAENNNNQKFDYQSNKFNKNQPIQYQNNFVHHNNFVNQNNPPHQNNFIQTNQNNLIQPNKRQLEKQKLQNPNLYDQNPFVPRKQLVKKSVDQKQQKPIVNQRQLQIMKLQQQVGENPFLKNQYNFNKNMSQQKNIPHQSIQNLRQKQKQKLQRQLHNNNDFDIYKRPTSPPQIPAQRDDIQHNISKKAAFQNRYSNPFVKDQQFIKQKRQQQQREYRKALQQQKKIQQQRKKMQKKMVKQQKFAYNGYQPGNNPSNNRQQQQSQISKSPALNATKKVDPNGKPPSYNYEQISNKFVTSSDLQYMKMKANQLKQNYRRGRILHDQYIEQVKKLAEYYKVDFTQLIERKDLGNQAEDLPWIKQGKKKLQQNKYMNPTVNPTQKYADDNQKYNIIENEQSLEKVIDSQTSFKNNQQFNRQPSSPSKNLNSFSGGNVSSQQPPFYAHYAPNNNIYTQNLSNNGMNNQSYELGSTAFMQQFPQMDYDLMRRMFEELKAMRSDYTKSLQNQKMFLQQTFMKFVNNQMMNQQQQMNSQNIHNQEQRANQNSKNKKNGQFSPKPNKKQKILFSESSQQQLTDQSVQYIQKSLSGIANKIPFYSNSTNKNISNTEQSFVGMQANFNKKRNGAKQKSTQTVQQFFYKPYKTKKFKKFSIMVDITQSSLQIPNVSNFLALKNGKDVVNRLFQQDLLTMKRLQRQKEVQKLKNKVDSQLNYNSYVDTFSASKNIAQINYDKNNKKSSPNNEKQQLAYYTKNTSQNILITQNSNYQDYENYSRNKNSNQRQVKSPHQQNHRSYKKSQDQSLPESAFIKRHVSNHEQNLPNFADQSDIKVRSPVYYSPKLNSQILEQDEYQTAQKSSNQELLQSQFYGSALANKIKSPKQNTNKKYQMKKKDFAYEQQRGSDRKNNSRQQSPTFVSNNNNQNNAGNKNSLGGMMNVIQSNNNVLSKYQKNLNDYSPKKQQVDIKDYSSINSNFHQEVELKNYFQMGQNQGGSINNGQDYYNSPLVSGQNSHKYISVTKKYQQQIQQIQQSNSYNSSNRQNPSDKFNSQKYSDLHNDQYEQSLQTVRSQQQSVAFSKFNTNNKSKSKQKDKDKESPKLNKQQKMNINQQESYQSGYLKSEAGRSMKNSAAPSGSINISQTVQSYQQSSSRLPRPPLNKKRSSSRKKQSSIIRTKFQKDSILQRPPHEKSNIKIQQSHDLISNEPLQFDSNVYQSEYEQSIRQQEQKNLQKRIQNLQKQQSNLRNKSAQHQININPPVIIQPKSNYYSGQNVNQSKLSSVGGGKLKSLQQARNLAKQCKKKSTKTSQNEYQKYEQKMSQLQSFLTRKDDSIIRETKQTKTIKLSIQKSPAKNGRNSKNIMNLLDELQNESSYKEDFESYRQQSQRFG